MGDGAALLQVLHPLLLDPGQVERSPEALQIRCSIDQRAAEISLDPSPASRKVCIASW